MDDLYHLWPVMLRKNWMLRSADILLHIALDGEKKDNEKTSELVKSYAESFPNDLVRVFFVKNLGYQAGAVEAMLDGVRYRWFDGYDW